MIESLVELAYKTVWTQVVFVLVGTYNTVQKFFKNHYMTVSTFCFRFWQTVFLYFCGTEA
jgi:hypothetical protein